MSSISSSNMYDVLPSALFERITKMKRIGKSTVKIQPVNNGAVNSSQSSHFNYHKMQLLILPHWNGPLL